MMMTTPELMKRINCGVDLQVGDFQMHQCSPPLPPVTFSRSTVIFRSFMKQGEEGQEDVFIVIKGREGELYYESLYLNSTILVDWIDDGMKTIR